ncbi:hypothetical protein CN902_26430 [Priestia megaterium]|uniref:hypothetical protein n=1 Tax=Priestia megaterium TaxID=1404 RepID=UPI000BFB7587|nr:hypothetical protein [Priestia megaterium]PGK22443.1 hypothetical protein CN902_26430 [Priestia megaterium]
MNGITPQTGLNVLYSRIIEILTKIEDLNSEKNGLSMEIQEKVVTYTTKAFEYKKAVNTALDVEQIISTEIIDNIAALIKDSKVIFPDFLANLNGHESLLMELCKKILLLENPNFEVDTNGLNLRYREISFIVDEGFIQDEGDNYIVVFPSFSYPNNLVNFLDSISNLNLLFIMLESIDINHMPEGENLALIDSSIGVCDSQLSSYIKLKKLSQGDVLHEDYIYDKPIHLVNGIFWDINNKYHQFDEIFYVLSEYNQQNSILDKYLKIYQVIENFKYRSKIAQLIDEYGTRMFSIRKFKDFYSSIEKSESNELRKLIKNILQIEITVGNKFKDLMTIDWNEYISFLNRQGHTITDLQNELKAIGCAATPGITEDFLTTVIYSLRNSIAHNKETEIHLTHGNLNEYPIIKEFISEFLLKILEKVVFSLLIKNNTLIWYSNSKLKLYNEDI